MTRVGWLSHPAVILGILTLAIHVFANQHYDFFRDELYFIVCGLHPAWGYVDQPPLAPLVSPAYWALPVEDRAKAAFAANNYGEAAAVDVFGDRLPRRSTDTTIISFGGRASMTAASSSA